MKFWGAVAAHVIVFFATYLYFEAPRMRTDLDRLLALAIVGGSMVLVLPLNMVIGNTVPMLVIRLVAVVLLCGIALFAFTGIGFLKNNTPLVLSALAASLTYQLVYSRKPETMQADHRFPL